MSNRRTGVGGHLSPEDRETMKECLAQNLPVREIMAIIGCNKQTVSDWRQRIGIGLISRNSIHRPLIPKLCLVNECHQEAVTGKYCVEHERACGQRGRESEIPMSRLMGGRA